MLLVLFMALFPLWFCMLTFRISAYHELKRNGGGRKLFPLKSILLETTRVYEFMLVPFELIWRRNDCPSSSGVFVFLLPGYLETRFVFRRIMKLLKQRGAGYRVLQYKPFLGDLRKQAELLKKEVNSYIASEPDARLVIIGHSMGGLVARYALENNLPDRRIPVIMIATPHLGTCLAKYVPGRCAKQMVPGSDFIDSLSRERPGNTFNIYSDADNIICPPGRGVYLDRNLLLRGHPLHNSCVSSEQTLKFITAVLDNETDS